MLWPWPEKITESGLIGTIRPNIGRAFGITRQHGKNVVWLLIETPIRDAVRYSFPLGRRQQNFAPSCRSASTYNYCEQIAEAITVTATATCTLPHD